MEGLGCDRTVALYRFGGSGLDGRQPSAREALLPTGRSLSGVELHRSVSIDASGHGRDVAFGCEQHFGSVATVGIQRQLFELPKLDV